MILHQNKLFDIKSLIETFDIPVFKKNFEIYTKLKIYPKLAVVLTSDDPGSVSYAKGVKKMCTDYCVQFQLEKTSSIKELEITIDKLNNDKTVHGIMVLYPTPYDIDDVYFMNMVSMDKDVEGLRKEYLGYLVQYQMFSDVKQLQKNVIPPTPKGIFYVLKRYSLLWEKYKTLNDCYPNSFTYNPFTIAGKRVTVINDSLAVGRSLALMLLNEDATPKICHSHTPREDMLDSVSKSDIIISAVPSGKFIIPTDYIKENSLVFDVSFEGNFDYDTIFDKVFMISPRWDLVEKGNRINDMTLYRLISNLFILIAHLLPEEHVLELKNFCTPFMPFKV